MRTIWGIHNDRKEIDPSQDRAVRIGWDELGDLSELDASRAAFKKALSQERPEAGKGAIQSGLERSTDLSTKSR